jgi:hypothetical protein
MQAVSSVWILNPGFFRQFWPKYLSVSPKTSGCSLTMSPICTRKGYFGLCNRPLDYTLPIPISLPSLHHILDRSYGSKESRPHEEQSFRILDTYTLPPDLHRLWSHSCFPVLTHPFRHLYPSPDHFPPVDLFRHLSAYSSPLFTLLESSASPPTRVNVLTLFLRALGFLNNITKVEANGTNISINATYFST